MSNVEKLPVTPREDNRSVTLIGTNLPAEYLDEAEPSPLMHSASVWWRRTMRTLQVLAGLALLAIYPTLVVSSHEINDEPVILSANTPWASPESGTAITLIGREIEGAGWTRDLPAWHPQARLTGLPAWQEALSVSLSDYVRLMADNAHTPAGNPDPDLFAAARLLAPEPGLDQIPRLTAAAEALARYEGRLERGLASGSSTSNDIAAELTLLSAWAETSYQQLSERIGTRDGWPASEEDVAVFFQARARAHVASQMLTASLASAPSVAVQPEVLNRLNQIEGYWRRAATLNPLFVSSQAGDARLMADHLAMMAYYQRQAGDATKALVTALGIAKETQAQTVSADTTNSGEAAESDS